MLCTLCILCTLTASSSRARFWPAPGEDVCECGTETETGMAKPPAERATLLMCGIEGRALGKSEAALRGLPCDEPVPERKSNQLPPPSPFGCEPPVTRTMSERL